MAHADTVRVGVIGAGGICRSRHLPGLAEIAGVEVVAVANRSTESGRKVADDFGIRHVAAGWRELLARDDVDAVFIGTWPSMHCEMSIAALEAGKHCFCQARMAMDLDEAKAMLSAAEARSHLVNMICPPPTRMPFEPFVRRLLVEGALGQITAVELVSIGGGNLDRQNVHWRERSDLSGKQIMAVGIFAETLNAWVGRYAELTAHLSTPIPTKRDAAGREVTISIPQVVSVAGRLENGALAVEHHSGVATDETTARSELTIWGLDGTLRYQFGDVIEMALAGEALKPVDVPDELQRPWRAEADFVTAVRAARAGQPPEARPVSPDFAEALYYMQKIEAIHASAATGRAVAPADL